MLAKLRLVRQQSTLNAWGSITLRSCANLANIWATVPVSHVPPSKMESFTERYLSFQEKNNNHLRESICADEILGNFDLSFTPKLLKSILQSTPNGIRFSMLLREDLNKLKRKSKESEKLEKLRCLDAVIAEYLGSVFCRNMLSHQRITFENSSGIVLEKLGEAEAVHKIRTLSEFKKRLSARGRRCFALFHPCLDNEPLTFVHVSLSREITTTMRDIYENEETVQPTCAIYYSINSPHAALSGLQVAESLLKRTASELTRLHPTIQTHSTLSPIPGFMRWLSTLISIPENTLHAGHCQKESDCVVNIPSHILDDICTALQTLPRQKYSSTMTEKEVLSLLYSSLSTEGWHVNEQFCNAIKQPLLWLCHYYLLEAKVPLKTGNDAHKAPLDPVARFHLRNGAIVHQINWLANTDYAALKSSAGMMVNYKYDLSRVEDLKQDFQSSFGVIPTGQHVSNFLK